MGMWPKTFALLLPAILSVVHSRSIIVSNTCQTDLDNFGLGKCLRPWLDTWELLREHRAEAGDLSFPILYYTREEVLALCDVYVETLDECLTQEVLTRCAKNPMVEFVQSHVGFVCGVRAIEVLAQFDCISSAVREEKTCQQYIRGPAQPESQALICEQMPRFYYCLEKNVFGKCGNRGLAVLVQAIDGFGCDVSSLENVPKPLLENNGFGDYDTTTEMAEMVEHTETEKMFPVEGNQLFPSIRITMPPKPELPIPTLPMRKIESLQGIQTDLMPKLDSGRPLPIPPLPSITKSEEADLSPDHTPDEEIFEVVPEKLEEGISSAIPEPTAEPSTTTETSSTTIIPALKLEDDHKIDAVAPKNIGSFGQKTPKDVLILPTTKAPATANTPENLRRRPETIEEAPEKCGTALESELIKCFAPISHKWDEILSRNNTPPETIFPTFQYKTNDLLRLCDILQATIDDCLTDQILTECEEHPILAFVDSVLGFSCGMKKTEFFLNYDCTYEVQRQHPECERPILGQPSSALLLEEKCFGIPEYFTCMERNMLSKCGAAAVDVLLKTIYHFGCDPTKTFKRKQLEGPDFLGGSPVVEVWSNGLDSGPNPNNPFRVGAPPPGVPPPPVGDSGPVLSGFCTNRIRRKLKTCLNPLFFQWVQFREAHGERDNITFPLFNYKRTEILELCDLYASAFIGCDFPLFDVCQQHDIVRFAHNHLGYICSPDRIESFMDHFGCISEKIHKGGEECMVWIHGETTPGDDLARCRGMPNFYECARKDISTHCKPGALTELQNLIRQYGCDVNEPRAV